MFSHGRGSLWYRGEKSDFRTLLTTQKRGYSFSVRPIGCTPAFWFIGRLTMPPKIIRYLRINILTRASKCAIILLQRKVESSISTGHLPQIGARMRSRNILMVFYPTGAAHGLTARCAVARHGPSRVLGPCPKKLDGLSCMHQLFLGWGAHQLYFVTLERGILWTSIKNRCSCRIVPATRRTPEVLTVSSSSANGAKPYFGWRLEHLKCCWWFYKSSSASVRCLRSKARWCSKREARLIFVY